MSSFCYCLEMKAADDLRDVSHADADLVFYLVHVFFRWNHRPWMAILIKQNSLQGVHRACTMNGQRKRLETKKNEKTKNMLRARMLAHLERCRQWLGFLVALWHRPQAIRSSPHACRAKHENRCRNFCLVRARHHRDGRNLDETDLNYAGQSYWQGARRSEPDS